MKLKKRLLLGISIFLVAIELAAGYFAELWVPKCGIFLSKHLGLKLVYNHISTITLPFDIEVPIALIGAVVATIFGVHLLRQRASPLKSVILVMVMAGVLGNTSELIIKGFVTDYIYYYSPLRARHRIGNLADIMITVGVTWILIDVLFRRIKRG